MPHLPLRLAVVLCASLLGFLVLSPPAAGSFHLMQIEQAIGGICGDVTAQAVQLRMRAAGQNLVDNRAIDALDANSQNAVAVVDFDADVANAALGARILVATPAFEAATGLTADFVASPIPASYLAAGQVLFVDGINIYWSLSWGGAAFLGDTTGLATNDADGDFGPPWDGVLPSTSDRALLFTGPANALSTSNSVDYALTVGSAVFTNNAGASAPVPGCVFGDGFESADTSLWSSAVP
ncbi:MAG: hypothetical protein DWQ36_20015 [Acidobacteria bacterium]|nr:MAG: hypothetical protein DWQ30_08350 [Acidobacteriota bacterium]REK03575.1 MAG: hypothetical protein DWQ36_20015 [Acidobacteriota bacterium]